MGKGSRFWFTLHLEESIKNNENIAEIPEFQLNNIKIQANVLLAEDNPINQQVAQQLLMKLGCNVMQGLLFSEPLLHENFTASIEKQILESV